jgi:hypothetical protein
MKYLFFTALLALDVNAMAIKLTRTTFPGFVRGEHRISTLCEIKEGKVFHRKQYSHFGISTLESKIFQIPDHERFKEIFIKASEGQIIESGGPVDVPSIIYTASNNEKEVILSSINGGNGSVQTNTSQSAKELIFLIDQMCGAN